VTGHTLILAWWVLGALFLLVVAVVVWTEQAVDADTDGGDADETRGGTMPSPWGEGDGIDWEAREQELARSRPEVARGASRVQRVPWDVEDPKRSSRRACAR
jgi:hypothetical protein